MVYSFLLRIQRFQKIKLSLRSSLVALLVCRLQVPVRLKPCRRYPYSLVHAASLCHRRSCQPRAMQDVLDTASVGPRSRPYISLDIWPVMDLFTGLSYVFIFLLYPRLVAAFSSLPPPLLCHRTSTFAAPFVLAPAVAPPYYIHSLLSF